MAEESPLYPQQKKKDKKNKKDKKSKKKKKEKKEKPKKKTREEIEMDIITMIANNDDVLLRISTFNTLKFEEMDQFCKDNEIKISNKDLKTFLDEQGICFSLPEDRNAVKGPRRVRRRKRKK